MLILMPRYYLIVNYIVLHRRHGPLSQVTTLIAAKRNGTAYTQVGKYTKYRLRTFV
jgi:hypothetical protein